MADRIVESDLQEVPEIPAMLEQVLIFALDEGKEKMEQGGEVVPFTTLAVKGNLFIETHPGECTDECFALARHTVEGARGADAYSFCYDGYVDTDEGTKDALISEGGIPGEDKGYAICYLYTVNGDINSEETPEIVFDNDPRYIGPAPNFMSRLKMSDNYSDEEINKQYTEEIDSSDEVCFDNESDFEAEEISLE